MKYNKLVRDKIPELISSKGENFKFHIADDKEFEDRLYEKLIEEANEFKKDPNIEELADIFEVLKSIFDLKGWKYEDIFKLQSQKREERGGFEKRIILDES